jgi:hypothetical protein
MFSLSVVLAFSLDILLPPVLEPGALLLPPPLDLVAFMLPPPLDLGALLLLPVLSPALSSI